MNPAAFVIVTKNGLYVSCSYGSDYISFVFHLKNATLFTTKDSEAINYFMNFAECKEHKCVIKPVFVGE